jgi:nucleotide-binding universal stress UspA family protein
MGYVRRDNQSNAAEAQKSILVAVKSSKNSELAFNWLLQNFKKYAANTRFTILTVHNSRNCEYFSGMQSECLADNILQIGEHVEKDFQESIALIRDFRSRLLAKFEEDTLVRMVVSSGDAGEAIVEFAQQNKVDCVILGSSALSLKRVVFGSLGGYVSRNMKCPVVVVTK